MILPDDGSAILQFDLTISEQHTATSTATSHAVEVGSNVTDHVRSEGATFECVVLTTNTPITDTASGGLGSPQQVTLDVPSFQPPLEATPGSIFRAAESALGAAVEAIFGGPPPTKATLLIFPEGDYIQNMHIALVDLQQKGITSQLVTSTLAYVSMVLTGVSMPRTEFGSAEFHLTFKEIFTVTTETVAAPKPKKPSGVPIDPKGTQTAIAIAAIQAAEANATVLAGASPGASALSKLFAP